MDNQVHIEIKEKLEVILQKIDYTQANIYESLKEAIECQMPYDTSLNTSRKFNIPFELIQLYFLHTPLKDFKEQKDFYVKNKEQASFVALLFLADKEKVTQFKAIEKAKLLIDWGYNIEARLDKPHFNQFVYFDYSEVGLSLLHYATSKPLIEYLIEKGANLYAQAQCAYQYSIKLLVDSGITQIKNQKHWESFLFYEKQVSYKMGKNELTISDLKKQYKQPNRYLNLYQQHLNPLELAKFWGHKGKIVLLEKATLTNPNEQVDKIIELINQSHYKEATRLFNLQVKIENDALFERLGEFKDLGLSQLINTQENIILQMVYQQKIEWFKKASHLGMVQNYTSYPYLLFATQQHKTLMFIHLYENGYNNEIDFVLPYINARVKEYKDNPLDSMNRDFVPLLITRYLMSKDYVFEHKYFIEEAIKKEQVRLDELMNQTLKDGKKRKI